MLRGFFSVIQDEITHCFYKIANLLEVTDIYVKVILFPKIHCGQLNKLNQEIFSIL